MELEADFVSISPPLRPYQKKQRRRGRQAESLARESGPTMINEECHGWMAVGMGNG